LGVSPEANAFSSYPGCIRFRSRAFATRFFYSPDPDSHRQAHKKELKQWLYPSRMNPECVGFLHLFLPAGLIIHRSWQTSGDKVNTMVFKSLISGSLKDNKTKSEGKYPRFLFADPNLNCLLTVFYAFVLMPGDNVNITS
jgi:hypothetical protein